MTFADIFTFVNDYCDTHSLNRYYSNLTPVSNAPIFAIEENTNE